jgi:hypothetical protein
LLLVAFGLRRLSNAPEAERVMLACVPTLEQARVTVAL